MTGQLDEPQQHAVRRHAGKHQAAALQRLAVVDVDLVAVAVTLEDALGPVDLPDPGPGHQVAFIGAETHGAAEVAAGVAGLAPVAAHPLGEQAAPPLGARSEPGRAGPRKADLAGTRGART